MYSYGYGAAEEASQPERNTQSRYANSAAEPLSLNNRNASSTYGYGRAGAGTGAQEQPIPDTSTGSGHGHNDAQEPHVLEQRDTEPRNAAVEEPRTFTPALATPPAWDPASSDTEIEIICDEPDWRNTDTLTAR